MMPKDGPELFVGLVGAVGTDLDRITSAITSSLKTMDYAPRVLRLSELLHEIHDWINVPSDLDRLRNEIAALKTLTPAPEDERITKHMDTGNLVRKLFNRGDGLAQMTIGAIRDDRREISGNENQPAPRTAFLLNSLKHPDEARTLRRTYGSRFFLVAGYAPRETRIENLARRISKSRGVPRWEDSKPTAEQLATRDEQESGEILGQNVSETYAQSDVFLDTTSPRMEPETQRFLELVFGNPFHTPSRDESGMFMAQAAAVRSAALSRQVGAALTTEAGSIVAVGSNEVPRAEGGQYWEGDPDDRRDFRAGHDESDAMRRFMIREIFEMLRNRGWLSDERRALGTDSLVGEAILRTQQDREKLASLVKRFMEAEGGAKSEIESLMVKAGVSKEETGKIGRLLSDIEAGRTKTESYLVNLLEGALSPPLKNSMISELTEYTRTVHAEMAAIIDAAHRGVAVARCCLYTTTFPCHECTRHIIAAGVARLIYVEPYPKSYAKEQHGDAIVVDTRIKENHKIRFEPFVGVAPRRYMSLFALEAAKRKNEDGSVRLWSRHGATPTFHEPALSYLNRETDLNEDFNQTLIKMGLIEEKTREGKDARAGMAETAAREKRE